MNLLKSQEILSVCENVERDRGWLYTLHNWLDSHIDKNVYLKEMMAITPLIDPECRTCFEGTALPLADGNEVKYTLL